MPETQQMNNHKNSYLKASSNEDAYNDVIISTSSRDTSPSSASLQIHIIQVRNVEGYSVFDSWDTSSSRSSTIEPYCIVRWAEQALCNRTGIISTDDAMESANTTTTTPSSSQTPSNNIISYFFNKSLEQQQHHHNSVISIEVYNQNNIMYFDMYGDDDSTKTPSTGCEISLGHVHIPIKQLLCQETDSWWELQGVTSGTIRIKTHFQRATDEPQKPPSPITNDKDHDVVPLTDQYGFPVPTHAAAEWNHLKSYANVRSKRQNVRWNSWLRQHTIQDFKEFKVSLRPLVLGGIPSHLREEVFLYFSGAASKKQSEAPTYYQSVVKQTISLNTKASQQIELDITRTFGHSRTKISTEEGRSSLRRVLRAYSIRNPTIGYCQGLNFIVGFFLLMFEEENVFWLLSAICEDLYSGYYTPTMLDTQTDMLVLNELIAERLPALYTHAESIDVPLELVASQWLLCLFTTTFPAETVLRILDCTFFEGPSFIFAVVISHLRQEQSMLLDQADFQSIISHLKNVESSTFDADKLIRMASAELFTLPSCKLRKMQQRHRIAVEDEYERTQRLRELQSQLAIVQELPAFSVPAANMLRFFHSEAQASTRNDVAYFLSLLCHGIVWFAEKTSFERQKRYM